MRTIDNYPEQDFYANRNLFRALETHRDRDNSNKEAMKKYFYDMPTIDPPKKPKQEEIVLEEEENYNYEEDEDNSNKKKLPIGWSPPKSPNRKKKNKSKFKDSFF